VNAVRPHSSEACFDRCAFADTILAVDDKGQIWKKTDDSDWAKVDGPRVEGTLADLHSGGT
jgi:hypothetical protein